MNLLEGISVGRYISCSTRGGVHFQGFLLRAEDGLIVLRPEHTREGYGWITARLDDISTVEPWAEGRVHLAFPWLVPEPEAP